MPETGSVTIGTDGDNGAGGWSSITPRKTSSGWTNWTAQQGTGYTGDGTRFIFVDPGASGDDTNPGTLLLPKKTIQKAIQAADGTWNVRTGLGDWVLIKAGGVFPDDSLNGYADQNFSRYGKDAQNPTVFAACDFSLSQEPPIPNPGSGGARPEIRFTSSSRGGHCLNMWFNDLIAVLGLWLHAYKRDPTLFDPAAPPDATVAMAGMSFFTTAAQVFVLVEDNKINYFGNGIDGGTIQHEQGTQSIFRRNIVSHSYESSISLGTGVGMRIPQAYDGRICENLLWHNGYSDTVYYATTNDKIYLHFNGANASTTMYDSAIGGPQSNWTARGNAQLDTSVKKYELSSLKLDGTGDYIDTPDNAAYTVARHAWEVMCYIKANVDGTALVIAGQVDAAGLASTNSAVGLARTSGNKVTFSWVTGTPGALTDTAGTTVNTITSTSNLNVAAGWVHVLASVYYYEAPAGTCSTHSSTLLTNLTINASVQLSAGMYVIGAGITPGTKIASVGGSPDSVTLDTAATATASGVDVRFYNQAARLFFNGVQEGSTTLFPGSINDSNAKWGVGSQGDLVSTPWNGWIDQFRLYVGFAETTTFTPPTIAGAIIYGGGRTHNVYLNASSLSGGIDLICYPVQLINNIFAEGAPTNEIRGGARAQNNLFVAEGVAASTVMCSYPGEPTWWRYNVITEGRTSPLVNPFSAPTGFNVGSYFNPPGLQDTVYQAIDEGLGSIEVTHNLFVNFIDAAGTLSFAVPAGVSNSSYDQNIIYNAPPMAPAFYTGGIKTMTITNGGATYTTHSENVTAFALPSSVFSLGSGTLCSVADSRTYVGDFAHVYMTFSGQPALDGIYYAKTLGAYVHLPELPYASITSPGTVTMYKMNSQVQLGNFSGSMAGSDAWITTFVIGGVVSHWCFGGDDDFHTEVGVLFEIDNSHGRNYVVGDILYHAGGKIEGNLQGGDGNVRFRVDSVHGNNTAGTTITSPTGPHLDRTVSKYATEILGITPAGAYGYQDFIALAAQQGKAAGWSAAYTAPVVNSYIRAGFGMADPGSPDSPPVTPPVPDGHFVLLGQAVM